MRLGEVDAFEGLCEVWISVDLELVGEVYVGVVLLLDVHARRAELARFEQSTAGR